MPTATSRRVFLAGAVAGCMATVSLETGRRVGFDRGKLELV
jgi:hypothetical protein